MSNPPTLAPAKDADEARERFSELDRVLNTEFIERRHVIHTMVNALVSGTHHFQLGTPGVGKSALIVRAILRIAGLDEDAFFHWLLTKFTDPNELFGPPSLSALKRDEYVRITKGKLPVATFVFLDEIFKANSAILNALLTIANERIFFNGTERIVTNISTIFAASNEGPAGEELAALYDRLHFRHYVKPLQSASSFIHMMQLEWDPEPSPIIHFTDISVAKTLAAKVEVGDDIYEALRDLRHELKKEGVEPTERRFREAVKIIRASAWLIGRERAEIEDMSLLQHVFWDQKEQMTVVARAVMALANPLDKKAQDLLEDVDGLGRDIDKLIAQGDSVNSIARNSVEHYRKMKKLRKELKELIAEFRTAGRRSQYLADVVARFEEVAATLQEKALHVSDMANLHKLEEDDA